MNAQQEEEIAEFVKGAMQAALDEIKYMQRMMRQQLASAPCVILRLEAALALMEEK